MSESNMSVIQSGKPASVQIPNLPPLIPGDPGCGDGHHHDPESHAPLALGAAKASVPVMTELNKEWLSAHGHWDRHGNIRPSHNSISSGSFIGPINNLIARDRNEPEVQLLLERMTQILEDIRIGRVLVPSDRVLCGYDEKTNLDFARLQRFVKSAPFQRMHDVMQVYPRGINQQVRGATVMNRASHGLDAGAYAVLVAVACGMSPYQALLGALGHDVGHVALGHSGEDPINELSMEYGYGGFDHSLNGGPQALKLLMGAEIADAWAFHSWSEMQSSWLNALVKLSDRTYMAADVVGLVKVGIVDWNDCYKYFPELIDMAELTKAEFSRLETDPARDEKLCWWINKGFARDVIGNFNQHHVFAMSGRAASAMHQARTVTSYFTFANRTHNDWQRKCHEVVKKVVTAHMVKHAPGIGKENAFNAAVRLLGTMGDLQLLEYANAMGVTTQGRDPRTLYMGPSVAGVRRSLSAPQPAPKRSRGFLPLDQLLGEVKAVDGRKQEMHLDALECLEVIDIATPSDPGARTLPWRETFQPEGPHFRVADLGVRPGEDSRLSVFVPGPEFGAQHVEFVDGVRRAIGKAVRDALDQVPADGIARVVSSPRTKSLNYLRGLVEAERSASDPDACAVNAVRRYQGTYATQQVSDHAHTARSDMSRGLSLAR